MALLQRVAKISSLPSHSHHRTRPERSQKWERHPVLSHIDGLRLGRPLVSRRKSHRGATPLISSSSIFCPQPQGQRIPTHQSSPSSRASATSRIGRQSGRLSPSTTHKRRAGRIAAFRRRHQRGDLIGSLQRASATGTAVRATAPMSHDPRRSPANRSGMTSPDNALLRLPPG